MKKLGKFKLVIIAVIGYVVLFIFNRDGFFSALNYTKDFLVEMFQILPPVMVITALISVWVPSSVIQKGLGKDSGLKGTFLSFLVGGLSAGPIYAAFPAAIMLLKKGASVLNIVIILSSWAVVKLPMIIVEINFLGAKFALSRVLLTIPTIYLMGLVVQKFVSRKDIEVGQQGELSVQSIVENLPNLNCRACGFESCNAFAESVFNGDKNLDDCLLRRKNEDS